MDFVLNSKWRDFKYPNIGNHSLPRDDEKNDGGVVEESKRSLVESARE